MANLPLADAIQIRDEAIPNANTATRVGQLFEEIVNFVNLSQVPDGILTPPALVANVNDYNPVGFTTSNLLRMESVGANYRVTGFLAPPAGVNRIITIVNIGASGDRVDLRDNDAGSLAANRILMGGNKNLDDNEVVRLWYDHVSLRWRLFGVGI